MGALIRAHGWLEPSLGPPSTWPQALRLMIGTALDSPMQAALLWGPDLLFLYNDAFIPLLGTRHPSALGRPVAKVWGSAWDQVSEPFYRALQTGKGFAARHVEIPMMRWGKAGSTYWDVSTTPIRGEDGKILGLLTQANDVSGQVLGLKALQDSQERLQALVSSTSYVVYSMSADWTEMRQLEGNDFLSDTHAPSRTWLNDYIFEDDQPAVLRAIQQAIASKSTFELEHRVRRADGSLGWALSRAVPLFDNAGEIREWFGAASDVTDRRRSEERQQFLMRELDHRGKNVLAVVQAAVSLTRASDLPSYIQAVNGRISALARAQTILADGGWDGTDLEKLLRGELHPFVSAEQNIILDGSRLMLPARATQPLSMAVHELATNAVKYGALSVRTGSISVKWHMNALEEILRLSWTEEGGPPVAGPPSGRGFGTRLLESTVRGQLGGALSFAWENTGLKCDIEIPLR